MDFFKLVPHLQKKKLNATSVFMGRNNVMTKFMINNKTDAWKTDVNLLSTHSLDLQSLTFFKPASQFFKPVSQFALIVSQMLRIDEYWISRKISPLHCLQCFPVYPDCCSGSGSGSGFRIPDFQIFHIYAPLSRLTNNSKYVLYHKNII